MPPSPAPASSAPPAFRLVVIGTSGSGKTTFAARLAAAAGLTHVELDVVNWRPGWYSLCHREPEVFTRLVTEATGGDRWVVSGGYSEVRRMLWSKATHLVWLDLPRWVVMRQVIWRSFGRAFWPRDVFPGCREDVWRMFTKDHPIRWAWDTHDARRPRYEAMLQEPAFAHLKVSRCLSRPEADAALGRLIAEARA